MRSFPLSLLAALALSPSLQAQSVSEIPQLTVPHSFIDMDRLPVGATSVAAINAAGTLGGATLARLDLLPTNGNSGFYELQTCGFGLAAAPGSGGTQPRIINGYGAALYDSFRASLTFATPCTEFGLMMGDWGGQAKLDFYFGGTLLTRYLTSTQLQCTPQFYAMTGGVFDRVEISVPPTDGNFVLLELYVEKAGIVEPVLAVTHAVAGSAAQLTVSDATPGGLVRAAYSLNGGGPTPTALGDLLLTRPIWELTTMTADAAGVASQSVPLAASTAGTPIWVHALDVDSRLFSNGVFLVIS